MLSLIEELWGTEGFKTQVRCMGSKVSAGLNVQDQDWALTALWGPELNCKAFKL